MTKPNTCWQYTQDPLDMERKISNWLTIVNDKSKANGWQFNAISCYQDRRGACRDVWNIDYAFQELTIKKSI